MTKGLFKRQDIMLLRAEIRELALEKKKKTAGEK